MINNEGRESRESRNTENHGGSWGSYSSDLAHHIVELYDQSLEQSGFPKGNNSRYAYSGIPLIFPLLQCLINETEFFLPDLRKPQEERDKFSRILNSSNCVLKFLEEFNAPRELIRDFKILWEIKHEINHPSPRPAGTPDNTPEYLKDFKKKNLLESTGKEESDYGFFGQLSSHKLFSWAIIITEKTAEFINSTNRSPFQAAWGMVVPQLAALTCREDLDSVGFDLKGLERRPGIKPISDMFYNPPF